MDAASLIKQERNMKLYKELCTKYPGHDAIFKYFISLNENPRTSGNTKQASEWAIRTGKALGGEVKSDKLGNVVVKFPAHPGCENWPGVVVQGHLDMVGTKAADKDFDFHKETVEMYIDGEKLRAKGTTLGGDDGTGVATAFALAEDKTIKRGPYEIMCTIDEEIGLIGASGLVEGELLSKDAKYLINVDSEDWGQICLSCAGGAERLLHLPVVREPAADYEFAKMTLKDFCGGHTGVEINSNRANACRWAATILSQNAASLSGVKYVVDAFNGGNAHNAVPSFCTVVFGVEKGKLEHFKEEMQTVFAALKTRWAKIEVKDPKMLFEAVAAPEKPLTRRSSKTLMDQILGVHHGVFRFSEELDDLVETSESLSLVTLNEKEVVLDVYARSNTNSRMPPVLAYLEAYAQIHGGCCVKKGNDMSGWPAEPDSLIAKKAEEIFEKKFGKKPEIVSIHAGLENGVIMGKYPANGIQSISIGPDVKNPHTIDEFVGIQSFCDLYDYVAAIMPELTN